MGTKQKWCCTTCGRSLTRRSSCAYHVRTQHQGTGYPVPDTEYVIGRMSGKFLPPPTPTSRPPTFKPKKGSLPLEDNRSNVASEIAKSLSELLLYLYTYSSKQTALNPYNVEGGLFGLQAYVCESCYMTKPRMIGFVKGRKGGCLKQVPFCMLRDDAKNIELLMSEMTKSQYIASLAKYFPDFLKYCVVNWTNNHAALIAAEATIDPASNKIIFETRDSQTGHRKSITLPYSEEKCRDIGTEGWAARAIDSGQTPVTDLELAEILQMMKDSTFGFFRVNDVDGSRIFLMALTKDEQHPPLLQVNRQVEANKRQLESPSVAENGELPGVDGTSATRESAPPISFSSRILD